MRYLIFIIITFILLSCAKKPKYSNIPEISLKSFDIISADSALLNINFSDGDGDIGGSPNGEGNFFIVYYFWDNTNNKYYVFTDTTFFQDSIDVRTFPQPSDSYKNKPISGEISLLLSPYRQNKTIKKLKLLVYIKDNSGNKSNIIQTPDTYAP